MFFVILGVTGCASFGVYNEATGRREFIFISTQEEVAMGGNLHRQIAEKYPLAKEGMRATRIQRIGQSLARESDRRDYTYRFYLVEKEELNAFTIPGGRIYIFTGLVDALGSDDRIASVLAHEIGHCAARHTIKKFQAAIGYELIGGLIFSRAGKAKSIASLGSGTVMNLIFSAYGRQDEYEADRLGVKYMAAAGYDLYSMVEALEILKRKSKGADAPLILRTHPHLADRITAVKQEIEKRPWSSAD